MKTIFWAAYCKGQILHTEIALTKQSAWELCLKNKFIVYMFGETIKKMKKNGIQVKRIKITEKP